MVHQINFDDDDIPLWKTIVAWLVLFAVAAGLFRVCAVPVIQDIGGAMLKQLEENRK